MMIEPIAFLTCLGLAILAGWGILRLHEQRQAREDERRWHLFQKHLREIDANAKYLTDDPRRPE